MAAPLTGEEAELRRQARRRLVGAIALVVVAAAVLPVVLDREPKPLDQSVVVSVPAAMETPVVPADPDAETQGQQPTGNGAASRGNLTSPVARNPAMGDHQASRTPEAVPASGARRKAQAPVAPAESGLPSLRVVAELGGPRPTHVEDAGTPGPVEYKSKGQKPVAPPLDGARSEANGFYVQFGVFSNVNLARQLRERLVRQGIGAVVDLGEGSAQMVRVRAGPFHDRDEAQVVRERARGMSADAVIVSTR